MVEIIFTNKDSQDIRLPFEAEELVFGPYTTLEYKSVEVVPFLPLPLTPS
jgi:hypothetical protein